jgi:hypothetical protein
MRARNGAGGGGRPKSKSVTSWAEPEPGPILERRSSEKANGSAEQERE